MILNGQLPPGLLAVVPGEPGARMDVTAALSWARLCGDVRARCGWGPRLTSAADAYRPYEVQLRIFRERYTTTHDPKVNATPPRIKEWDGVTYYLRKGAATAAVPGRSNHGLGIAVDVTGLGGFKGERFHDFSHIAPRHGWDNREGRSIGEAWHWVYDPDNDRRPPIPPAPPPRPPAPPAPEVDVSFTDEDRALLADLAHRRGDGFRFESEGVVYYANIATGAFYAVPNDEYRSVLDGLERDVLAPVNPRQRDLIRDLCRRAALSFASDVVVTLDAAAVAAAIPDDIAERVAGLLARRLTN